MKKAFRFLYLVLLPILMTTSGDFLLKHSINHHRPAATSTTATQPIPSKSPLRQPSAILAVTLITLGIVLWLVAMSKYELSFIYPFLSINYISVLIGSQWVLHESVGWSRYVSVIFIVIGLVLISRSPHSEVKQKET
jgi:drug/metabolite transporter (DMT)-like permease